MAYEANQSIPELRARCQKILYATAVGQKVSPEHFAFLTQTVLPRHATYEDKIGCGAESISVRPGQYGNVCFWITRTDRSETDFSFLKCLVNAKPISDVKQAMRHVVQEDIHAFKFDHFMTRTEVFCAITREPVGFFNSHVDHRPPLTFDRILADYCHGKGLTLAKIDLDPSADGQIGRTLSDRGLADDWRQYHAERAVLQITTPTANLKQGKGKARIPQP